MRGACVMGYNTEVCAQKRKILDDKFQATNSSLYNIYIPCYYQNLSLTTDGPQFKLTQSGGKV